MVAPENSSATAPTTSAPRPENRLTAVATAYGFGSSAEHEDLRLERFTHPSELLPLCI